MPCPSRNEWRGGTSLMKASVGTPKEPLLRNRTKERRVQKSKKPLEKGKALLFSILFGKRSIVRRTRVKNKRGLWRTETIILDLRKKLWRGGKKNQSRTLEAGTPQGHERIYGKKSYHKKRMGGGKGKGRAEKSLLQFPRCVRDGFL